MKLTRLFRPLCLCLFAAVGAGSAAVDPAGSIEIPVLDGAWWKIAEQSPDVSPYNRTDGQPVDACDFTIFQAADGTWQMIGCIRGCTWPTGNRIFHRWESARLTDTGWKPLGIFRTPDIKLQQLNSIQAPHCVRSDGKYYLYYNAATGFGKPTRQGNAAYAMVSEDGKNFRDLPSPAGTPWLFPMGRDINVFRDDGRWIAYFQDFDMARKAEFSHGLMFARTAPSVEGPWSEQRTELGIRGNPESPFVVKRGGRYYLLQQLLVFESADPLVFRDPPIARVDSMKWAPEIILHEGQYYIAAYNRGIWMARLKWESRTWQQIAEWRSANAAAIGLP